MWVWYKPIFVGQVGPPCLKNHHFSRSIQMPSRDIRPDPPQALGSGSASVLFVEEDIIHERMVHGYWQAIQDLNFRSFISCDISWVKQRRFAICACWNWSGSESKGEDMRRWCSSQQTLPWVIGGLYTYTQTSKYTLMGLEWPLFYGGTNHSELLTMFNLDDTVYRMV